MDTKMHLAFALVTAVMAVIMLGTVWLNLWAQGKNRQFHSIRLPLLFWGISLSAFLISRRFPVVEGTLFMIAFVANVAFLTAATQTNLALQPERGAGDALDLPDTGDRITDREKP